MPGWPFGQTHKSSQVFGTTQYTTQHDSVWSDVLWTSLLGQQFYHFTPQHLRTSSRSLAKFGLLQLCNTAGSSTLLVPILHHFTVATGLVCRTGSSWRRPRGTTVSSSAKLTKKSKNLHWLRFFLTSPLMVTRPNSFLWSCVHLLGVKALSWHGCTFIRCYICRLDGSKA